VTPEDAYNTSAVSFETIYEDEEASQKESASRSRFQRAMPVHRRRIERCNKRASINSLDESVVSIDSGFNQSDFSASEKGSEGSMLSVQPSRCDSGTESTPEGVDESRLPVLYVMKKPCRRRHPSCAMRTSTSEPSSLAKGQKQDLRTHSLPKLGVSAVHSARRISARSSKSSDHIAGCNLNGESTSASISPSDHPSDDGRTSAMSNSSSIADLIHDSELIIKHVMERGDVWAELEAFRKRPSTGASRKMMRTVREMVDVGALGFIAQQVRSPPLIFFQIASLFSLQMVPLMNECWHPEHVPSSEDILRRLNHVLPSASV
jgi:hypothetical protein